MDDSQNNNSLTKEQKTGFVLLLVFGILVVGLGMLQMRNTIYNPFAIQFSVLEEEGLVNDFEGRLKNLDTDHDGLMDWDELNIYSTSPYLSDTDSDGIEDKQEIDHDMDPLCPKGQDCGAVEYIEEGITTSTLEVGSSPLLGNVEDVYDVGVDSGVLADENGENMYTQALTNVDSLRNLLLTTGEISQEELEKIDDATLMRMTESLLQEDVRSFGLEDELITVQDSL